MKQPLYCAAIAIGLLVSSADSSVVVIDDFSASPQVQYRVNGNSSSDVTQQSANVLGGSRNVLISNSLAPASAASQNYYGYDRSSFLVTIGGATPGFRFEAPKFFNPTPVELRYTGSFNLTAQLQESFEVVVEEVDHWASVVITITDSNGNQSSSSQVPPAAKQVLTFPFANFAGTADFSSASSVSLLFNVDSSTDMVVSYFGTTGPDIPNVCPVATNDSLQVIKGSSTTKTTTGAITLISNDTDPDGSFLNVSVLVPPSHGTVSIAANGTFRYTHNGDSSTSDAFSYQIVDADGCPAVGLVDIVIEQNNCPIVLGESIEVVQGGTVMSLTNLEISLLANDSDPDLDRLSISLLTPPEHGSVTIRPDGSFTYIHDGSEFLVDGFSYLVTDANGCAVPGSVTISVVPCNDCNGKISQLTFVYQGLSTARLSAICKNGNGRGSNSPLVYSGVVQPGQVFVVDSTSNPDTRDGFAGTLGSELQFVVNGVPLPTTLHTSCSVPVGFGTIYGDFMVVGGYSKLGGAICPLE